MTGCALKTQAESFDNMTSVGWWQPLAWSRQSVCAGACVCVHTRVWYRRGEERRVLCNKSCSTGRTAKQFNNCPSFGSVGARARHRNEPSIQFICCYLNSNFFFFFVKLAHLHLHARHPALIYSDNDLGKQVENFLLFPEGSQCERKDSKATFPWLNKK